jgi:pimeloyl-ACP methyl ester carboxylesterase
VSTPKTLELPERVRRVTIESRRGCFAALEAEPTMGVCERRPALLIPGFTGSKEDFIPVLQSLASAGRRVVAIDMRGQYQSPGAPDTDAYAPGELAADIAEIAEAIAGGQGLHLVGHSLGGLIARETALAGSARIISLTLLSSGPGRITGQRAEMLRGMLAMMDSAGAAGLRAAVAQIWREHLAPEATAGGVPDHVIAFLHERMMGNDPAGLVAMGRYLLACPDRTAELADLDGPPVLVLYGENDDAWQPTVQELMARRLGAQRVCIPGAGHSPPVEAPETTASALTAFWRQAEDGEHRRAGGRRRRPDERRHADERQHADERPRSDERRRADEQTANGDHSGTGVRATAPRSARATSA